jgi:hypothetical protein
MYSKVMKELSPCNANDEPLEMVDICDIEEKLNYKFPSSYRDFLIEMKGSIMFNNGAIYKPIVNSPVDDRDGNQSLDILYGLTGHSNLVEINNMYSDQIPDEYVAIGGSSGGNLICLNKNDEQIYFWHHEALYDDEMFFKIANNIDEFINGLKKDDSEVNLTGVIESESFLDF